MASTLMYSMGKNGIVHVSGLILLKPETLKFPAANNSIFILSDYLLC